MNDLADFRAAIRQKCSPKAVRDYIAMLREQGTLAEMFAPRGPETVRGSA